MKNLVVFDIDNIFFSTVSFGMKNSKLHYIDILIADNMRNIRNHSCIRRRKYFVDLQKKSSRKI